MSFFFWLDTVATLSMIADIGWIFDNDTENSAENAGQLAKTTRAARVTKVVRLVRLIRLIRIVRLYKQAKIAARLRESARLMKKLSAKDSLLPKATFLFNPVKKGHGIKRVGPIAIHKLPSKDPRYQKRNSARTNFKSEEDELDDEDLIPQESKISKTLSEKTTKTVIILILLMLFLLPLFQESTYIDAHSSFEKGLYHLIHVYTGIGGTSTEYQTAYDKYLQYHTNEDTPLIYLRDP